MKYLLIKNDGSGIYANETLFSFMGEVALHLVGGGDDNETVQVLQFAEIDCSLIFRADITTLIANAVQATTEGRFITNDWQGDLSLHPIIKKATNRYLERAIDLRNDLDAAISEGGTIAEAHCEDAERFGLIPAGEEG